MIFPGVQSGVCCSGWEERDEVSKYEGSDTGSCESSRIKSECSKCGASKGFEFGACEDFKTEDCEHSETASSENGGKAAEVGV